jgi:hypothetical protein
VRARLTIGHGQFTLNCDVDGRHQTEQRPEHVSSGR